MKAFIGLLAFRLEALWLKEVFFFCVGILVRGNDLDNSSRELDSFLDDYKKDK